MTQKIEIIEIPDLGEVGAGKVVDFIPQGRTIKIPRPKNTTEKDALFSHSVNGDSLYNPFDHAHSVFHGDTLICRENFEVCEIKPDKVCIVFIVPTCERIAKKLRVIGDYVYLVSPNPSYPDRKYFIDDIEVKGLVIGFARSW